MKQIVWKCLITTILFLVLGFEANYNATSYPYSSPTCAAGRTDSIPGCNSSHEAQSSNSDRFDFTYSECSTPKVSSVTPSQGTSDTIITVHGHGFSNVSCHNKVMLSSHECEVISSDDTAIICMLSTAEYPIAGEALDVTVKILNRGYAFVRADAGDTVDFLLKPSVTAVSPSSGSQAGGTLVTITGDGFSNTTSDNVVEIGSTVCDVVTSSFDTIVCRTRASAEQAQQVIVAVRGSESECLGDDSTDCEYSFELDRTPMVTLVSPANIESLETKFRFQVSRLPSSAKDVTVTVGNEVCNVTEVLSQLVKCVLPGVVFGSHKIVIHVSGKGNAEFDPVSDVIDSVPLVSEVSPSQSSKHGGLVITIEGNGFNPTPGKTTVTIGGEICEIITVSYGVIKCVTPPHPLSDAALIEVTVDSGEGSRRRRNAGVVFPSITIAFTQAATPVVTSILPTAGQGGDVLTIDGSGLDPTQGEAEVQIGDVSCEVTSSEDNNIVCTLATHAAGLYLVDVVVPGKGRATSDVLFEYRLRIDSVVPDESGFGGGRLLSIQGQGFDESAVLTICGNECTHNSDHVTMTTEISCEAPSHALGNIDQVCDVEIVLNGFSSVLSNGFTYKPEMTSQIASVTPSRGGTGGGTILTILGSGFSDTQSDNIVTIDSVECNVTYANSSIITCQTGPHNGTIETKVRVEVGSNGKAIDDDADFFYVDVWSSPFTWGGNDPPENGMYFQYTVFSY